MRIVFFLALVANSLDLVATTIGIHRFHNREGNALLAPLAHDNWWLFVAIKGLLVPLLIVQLYRFRERSPVLSAAGMALVATALTIAVGNWLGWMAGVLHVGAAF